MPILASPTLSTERLIVRAPAVHDANDLLAIYADPVVARFLSMPPWIDLDDADAWLQRAWDSPAVGDALQCVLEHRDEGRVIGTCVLFHIHQASRRAELGYVLGSAHWGHGYMHEALCAWVAYGFGAMDLRRLEADIDPRNRASARSLERLGFKFEGRLRERWEVAGEVSDTDLYGLLRHEWSAPPKRPL